MQFTPESLGRVLKNVDRETLVAAIRVAKLEAVLRSDNIDTIEELQGLFNTVVNLAAMTGKGQKWNSEALEALRDKRKPTEVSAVYYSFILNLMISQAKFKEFTELSNWDKLFELPDIISEFL